MHLEVELKYPVEDLQECQQRLVDLGAQIGQVIEQTDYYFNHPSRDFAATDEALRIRRVGQLNRITFKGPKLDAETKTREEIDLPLGDGDDQAEQWRQLLELLDFSPVAIVRKRRRPGILAWRGAQVAIALDDVEGVGTFLELEVCVDADGLVSAKSQILDLANALELEKQERRSYLELLL